MSRDSDKWKFWYRAYHDLEGVNDSLHRKINEVYAEIYQENRFMAEDEMLEMTWFRAAPEEAERLMRPIREKEERERLEAAAEEYDDAMKGQELWASIRTNSEN